MAQYTCDSISDVISLMLSLYATVDSYLKLLSNSNRFTASPRFCFRNVPPVSVLVIRKSFIIKAKIHIFLESEIK